MKGKQVSQGWGTKFYQAPEVVRSDVTPNEKADVFRCGTLSQFIPNLSFFFVYYLLVMEYVCGRYIREKVVYFYYLFFLTNFIVFLLVPYRYEFISGQPVFYQKDLVIPPFCSLHLSNLLQSCRAQVSPPPPTHNPHNYCLKYFYIP